MTDAERRRRLAGLETALRAAPTGARRRDLEIEHAVVAGDLGALTTAVGDAPVPAVRMATGDTVLQFAIVLAPLAFVRGLLALGCDPDYPASDGFPALVSAILHEHDPDERRALVRVLLDAGADLHRYGHNGWGALHAAALTDDPALVRMILDAGADPHQPTQVDERWTAEEEADHHGAHRGAEAIRQWRAER